MRAAVLLIALSRVAVADDAPLPPEEVADTISPEAMSAVDGSSYGRSS